MAVTRAPAGAIARWALAVAVVLAVLGMHSLMSPGLAVADTTGHTSTAGHTDTAPADAGSLPHGAPAAAEMDMSAHPHTSSAATAVESCSGDCGGHGSGHQGHTLAHLCLAVLAGLLTVLVALALARTALPALTTARRRALVLSGGWRSPPWTHPCLAQLSVLRV